MEIGKMKKHNRINLHWASDIQNTQGNAYGYYVHNTMLKRYASKIMNIDENADNILFITSPEFLTQRPDDGKKLFLFTMFEGTTIPDQYLKPMGMADHLLAPSNWVADLFKKYFDKNKISVINHGVTEDFKYKKRFFPHDRPFRFLWVGAHNPRKGWEEVIHCWKEMELNKCSNVELYMKTSTSNKIERQGNIIFDSRNLSKNSLIKLYHSAHCFLFPSRGEGFGLTLAEAMRTGLPCIATNYSGQKDFFDIHVGYPIGYEMGAGRMKFIGTNEEADTQIAFPKLQHMATAMDRVYTNYEEATTRAKRAHERIKKFTWKRSAIKLRNIIQEYGKC